MFNNQISLDNVDLPPHTDATVKQRNSPHIMISFVQLDQSITAFSYGHLYKIAFDGSSTIVLTFMHDTVTIEGRGMEMLYSQLLVQQIQQVAVQREEHANGNVCVTQIQIKNNG